MKFTLKLTLIALTFNLCSCGDKKKEDPSKIKNEAKEQQTAKTHDSVSEEFVTSLGDMSDTLATISNLDSATSALPKLTKIGFTMNMIKTDMQKLDPPSKEEAARLDKEYGTKMKEIMSKIGQTMNGLKTSNPEAYGIVEKTMKTIMQ